MLMHLKILVTKEKNLFHVATSTKIAMCIVPKKSAANIHITVIWEAQFVFSHITVSSSCLTPAMEFK